MPPDDLAALQQDRLALLRRLVRLRKEFEDVLNDRGLRLLDHCLFSAYSDCRELGVGFIARAALRSPKEASRAG
jgi:hypothetical protein